MVAFFEISNETAGEKQPLLMLHLFNLWTPTAGGP